MNFLKLPLRPGFDCVNSVYYAFDLGDFPVFAIDPGACGMTMDEAEIVTNEIVQAVNERDPLLAQRDALAAACTVSRQMLADITKYYDVILQDVGMDAMVRRVEQATRAALALVKGEQKSDDADQD